VLDNYDLVKAGVLWRVVKINRRRTGDG